MPQLLTHFPHHHSGELVYSIIARYVYYFGLKNTSHINNKLLNIKHSGNIIDLPRGLAMLSSVTPPGQQLSSKKLIADHTLYRFHTAYTDSAYRQRVAADMLASSAPGKRIALRRKTVIEGLTHLRFCQVCNAEMLRDLGEAYWRREYQLPHIVACPTHRIALSKSQIALQTRLSLYNRADRISCPTDAPAVFDIASKDEMDILCRLAQFSIEILNNPLKNWERGSITSTYLDRLWRKGFCRSRKQINKSVFGHAIYAHFHPLTKFWPNLIDSLSCPPEWALNLLEKDDSNYQTIYHVLLQDFLDQHSDLKPDLGRISRKKIEIRHIR